MTERQLPSGLILSTQQELEEPKATSAVPASMCYVAGQMCRDLALMARDSDLRLEPDLGQEEIAALNTVRQKIISACGRACRQACRLPLIDKGAKSKLELQLDIKNDDIMTLLNVLKYMDENLEQEFEPRHLQPSRGIVDGYVGMLCERARQAGSKEFINPVFTDKYCAFFARFSGPNFRVVKQVTHNLTTISYGQQTGEMLLKTEAGFELDNPLEVSEQDLRSYLLGLERSTSYSLNLKSTERSDMFDAYA